VREFFRFLGQNLTQAWGRWCVTTAFCSHQYTQTSGRSGAERTCLCLPAAAVYDVVVCSRSRRSGFQVR